MLTPILIGAGLILTAAAIYLLRKLRQKPEPPMIPPPFQQPQSGTPDAAQAGGGQSGSDTGEAGGGDVPSQSDGDESGEGGQDSDQDGYGDTEPAQVWVDPAVTAQREAEIRSNEQKIKAILSGEKEVAALFAQANAYGTSAGKLLEDQIKIRELAAEIPPGDLEIYNLATQQDWLEFNLQNQTVRNPSMFPTNDVEILPISDSSQLECIMPDEYLVDNDEFARRLAMSETMTIQFFDRVVKSMLLYILLDISPSMDFPLESGLPRNVWARGVIVNLLYRAQRDGGKFFFREFSTGCSNLTVVDTPGEMSSLATRLLTTSHTGSGTKIGHAIDTAANDIRTLGGDVANAELLIITDGEDELDTDSLRSLLKPNINLHYVKLGDNAQTASESLRGIAKSYKQFK